MSQDIKADYERTITYLTTVSIFLIVVVQRYVEYAASLGITTSPKIVLNFSVYAVMCVVLFILYKLTKNSLVDEAVHMLNYFTLTALGVGVLFLSTMIKPEIFHVIGILGILISITGWLFIMIPSACCFFIILSVTRHK